MKIISQNDTFCINTIRTLSLDAIDQAQSGHPGLPLGAAPFSYVLWYYHLKHFPKNPLWPDRDRFVLSAGHGSMLLYSLLHLSGYDLSLDELKKFRQYGSLTPGHPEFSLTAGVEATTGPLGQGSANAVGMALAERKLANLYNKPGFEIIDHMTYCLVSDGDLMEGLSQEAASLAGHLKLGKLIYLYDSNHISLDGPTNLTYTEDTQKRFESLNWEVLTVQDADQDLIAINDAIQKAKTNTTQPSIIILNTTIGFGSSLQGSHKVHGSPLGKEETKNTKHNLSIDPDKLFYIPKNVDQAFKERLNELKQKYEQWESLWKKYQNEYPELAQSFSNSHKDILPSDWQKNLFFENETSPEATRKSSGIALNKIASKVPWLIGGDADLSCSTNTLIKDGEDFNGLTGSGRNIHYGVREHAMASISNGIAYHRGLRSYVATFFCFSDYMRPALRLSAMNHLPVIYIWTHDSIGLGEDGPTHQPIEHLASIRAIPNFILIRPADTNETAAAWKFAMESKDAPVGLVLSRQNLPILDQKIYNSAEKLQKGAYTLTRDLETVSPQVTLISTGSEVHLALEVAHKLREKNIKTSVVSMPSWELFERQSLEYRQKILPQHALKVSIEAASPFGWEKWVGSDGLIFGIDHFGASAPAKTIYERFGLDSDSIFKKIILKLKSKN